MTYCPCCSHEMLRHVRHQQMYWFCRSCWQEMPLIEQQGASRGSALTECHLATVLKLERALATV